MTLSMLAARGLELLLLLLLLLACVALALAPPGGGTRKRIAARVRQAAGQRAASPAALFLQPGDVRQDVTRRLAQLGERLPVLDPMQRVKLGLQLTRAGFRERRAVSSMIGIKLSAGVLFACVAIVFSPYIPRLGEYFVIRALAMVAAFVIGVIVPEYVLGAMIRRRRRIIAGCLPDALDLLVICTMAGNSLASGVRRVAHELARICPPLADELSVCADELTLSGDVAATLTHFATRVDLPSACSLATTLTQSQRFGTPITQALRTLARTERTEQIVALEEQAAKLAPKITLPMMLFILPTVCLIAAGPAAIRLLEVFR
ncbi:fimbrial protein [Burkholderia ubonensis]|uniref:type II secretion system F family protein n=1 Tax=Burkholderia ubonensis TaxID=101571 RepID=UPI0009001522|nr:type II secretion system F family protein [Burkholderia ubonensis]OJA45504.1 fimbrial protein [Burkholderia ubonensis]